MLHLTLTSKRQATLPKDLCDELGVGPGDQVDVLRTVIDGEPAWVLKSHRPDWSWVGAASRPAAAEVSHEMEDIRKSITRGRTNERA